MAETGIERVPDVTLVRQLADQAFSRASGAPLRQGNHVRLLKDASENYPAWLDAIRDARRTIHFEMYIIHEDDQGRLFADALLRKAADGVQVRLLYDWMGGFGKTSRRFWSRLRAGGVDVRCYNPPRLDRPLGWLNRDHRKTITVDGTVAFVTGLCVGRMWVGDSARHMDPWRDTGIEIRGPAVADVQAAFAEAWAAAGPPLPDDEAMMPEPLHANPAYAGSHRPGESGRVALRVVAGVPNTASLFRVDQLVAAIARRTLWLTDAYYSGTTPYVQALRAAAKDGVDVRLLVPGSSDIPLVGMFSRAGYRPLLEAGVRVFEWNGSMLHAKSAVADGRWGRVGSTNLNVASWIGNRELDVIIEDVPFAHQMEEMYLQDLAGSTEILLERNRVRAPKPAEHRHGAMISGGSGGRVISGAVRVGHTVAAAVANTRVLEPVEANIAVLSALLLGVIAVLAYMFPRGIAYPVAVLSAWFAAALLVRGLGLYRRRRKMPASGAATSTRPDRGPATDRQAHVEHK